MLRTPRGQLPESTYVTEPTGPRWAPTVAEPFPDRLFVAKRLVTFG